MFQKAGHGVVGETVFEESAHEERLELAVRMADDGAADGLGLSGRAEADGEGERVRLALVDVRLDCAAEAAHPLVPEDRAD